MPEKLPFSIKELLEKTWNEMQVYSLNDKQKQELLNNKKLIKREYFFGRGNEWVEHSHEKPQLLFILEGQLTHRANNKNYVQYPNNLLIVPTNLPHTAMQIKIFICIGLQNPKNKNDSAS